jgi:hypothetical protein
MRNNINKNKLLKSIIIFLLIIILISNNYNIINNKNNNFKNIFNEKNSYLQNISSNLISYKMQINSVSPIYPINNQIIYINGSGFGNIAPEILRNSDGSINTIKSGSNPSICITDSGPGNDTWVAGIDSSNLKSSIGIYLFQWTNNSIILGGFGSALGEYNEKRFNIQAGDNLVISIYAPDGSQVNYNVVVSPIQNFMKVSFKEYDLPSNYVWYVTLYFNDYFDISQYSTNNTINFTLIGSNYNYIVNYLNISFNYYPTPSNGSLIYNGTNLTVNIYFEKPLMLTDYFYKDKFLNTEIWDADSLLLSKAIKNDSELFEPENILNSSSIGLSINNSGLNIKLFNQGAYGITSTMSFVPPFIANISAKIPTLDSNLFKNPIWIAFVNPNSTSFLYIFVSNSIYIQTGNTIPKQFNVYIQPGMFLNFSFYFFENMSFKVNVFSSDNHLLTYWNVLPNTKYPEYYVILGSLNGYIVGESSPSPVSFEHTNISYLSIIVNSNKEYNVKIDVPHLGNSVSTFLTIKMIGHPLEMSFDLTNSNISITSMPAGKYYLNLLITQYGYFAANATTISLFNISDLYSNNVTIYLKNPKFPDFPGISCTIIDNNGTNGQVDFSDIFYAIPSLYSKEASYQYNWYINSKPLSQLTQGNIIQVVYEKNNITNIIFKQTGQYNISCNLSYNNFLWFDKTYSSNGEISSNTLRINIFNTPVILNVNPMGNVINATISYNNNENCIYAYFNQTLQELQLSFNVTDLSHVLSIPPFLSDLLGISNAYHGIDIKVDQETNSTDYIIQPGGGNCFIEKVSFKGVTNLNNILGRDITIIFTPNKEKAILGDLINVILGLVGVFTSMDDVLKKYNLNNLESEILLSLVLTLIGTFSSEIILNNGDSWQNILNNIITQLPNFLFSFIPQIKFIIKLIFPSFIKDSQIVNDFLLSIAGTIAITLVSWTTGVGLGIALSQFIADSLIVLDTIISGNIQQSFKVIKETQTNTALIKSNKINEQAPYVTVVEGSKIYGYNGKQEGVGSGFSYSLINESEYRIIYPLNVSHYEIYVSAPPDEKYSQYEITIYTNNTKKIISGNVSQGHTDLYNITVTNNTINIVYENTNIPSYSIGSILLFSLIIAIPALIYSLLILPKKYKKGGKI